MDSPVAEKVFGFQVALRLLGPESGNIFPGFSRSPFFASPCLTAVLRLGSSKGKP